MSRTTTTLTGSFQQVAAGACIVQVDAIPSAGRTLSLNETASDVSALKDLVSPGDQFAQNEAKATYAKGDGIVITVDEAG